MAARAISARPALGGSVGWTLAALLLAPIAACGGAGAPDDAPAANGLPASADPTTDVAPGEVPAGSAPAEPGSAAGVFVNGEELPPELADAVQQAMQDQAQLPPELAEQLMGRFGTNADPAPLPDDVGPDWAEVEAYLDEERAWMASGRERAEQEALSGQGASSEELARNAMASLADRPDINRAIAAARAILNEDGAHDKTVEAAEFLVMRVHSGLGVGEHIVTGAKALLAHAPDYDDWPQVLSLMDSRRMFGGAAIDTFFEELASEADDPVLRASARYYVATGLMHAANGSLLGGFFSPISGSGPTADTEAKRQQALEAATGLSAGVEEEQFLGKSLDGPSTPMTLGEAEADLIRSIRHGTIGATLPPEVTATRLDGVEESLADYRGRVVLLDFWATWCPPCVDVLPELRELVAEMPADRFALIAISVDDEVETVTRFMEDEPMPWTNWHVGRGSDIGRLLRVQGYPTYVLVDENGRILSRPLGSFRPLPSPDAPGDEPRDFPGSIPALVKEAVARLAPA